MIPLWDFTDLIPADRSGMLLGLRSFDEVLHKVTSTCTVARYKAEAFRGNRDGLQGCMRAIFLLHVDFAAYDGFFNSPVGYRAQYCVGSNIGEFANRQMLNILRPTLIASAGSVATQTFCLDRVELSLNAADAKIWIDENEPASHPPQALQVHINYLPWIQRAKRADELQEEEFIGATRGVFAPIGTRLEIKGGWLDENGLEMRDPTKTHRSEDIALNGYV